MNNLGIDQLVLESFFADVQNKLSKTSPEDRELLAKELQARKALGPNDRPYPLEDNGLFKTLTPDPKHPTLLSRGYNENDFTGNIRLVFDKGDTVLKTPSDNDWGNGVDQNRQEYRLSKKYYGKLSFIPLVLSYTETGYHALVMKKYKKDPQALRRGFLKYWEDSWENISKSIKEDKPVVKKAKQLVAFAKKEHIRLKEIAREAQWAVDANENPVLIDLGH